MRIYAANSVFIEVTRRCNMCCAHCLRGDAESIDIQEKYIDAFLDSFEKGAYISSLTFTGGEISLNIPAIRYTLKAVKERGIAVGSFYMVTNGKAVDKMADLAMASLEWWNYCDDKDDYSCGLCISSDDFHEAIPYESKSMPVEEKLDLARECGLQVTADVKEGINQMCNYSDYVEQKGIEKGRIETLSESVVKLVRSGTLTLDAALDVLQVSDDIRATVKENAEKALNQ